MQKLQWFLLALIVIGLGLIFTQKFWVESVVNFILSREENEMVVKNSPLNISVTIDGEKIEFLNGYAEREAAPGSSLRDVVIIFGNPTFGDLNGDGTDDAAMYLVRDSGGSGVFVYAVLAISDKDKFVGTNAIFLGDRIAPQNINILDNRAVFNFADRKPDEPFSVKPSVGKSVWINYDPQSGEISALTQ